MTPFSRPSGLVDRQASVLHRHRWVQARLAGVFGRYGDAAVDVPLLEYRPLYDAETLGAHLFHDLVLARMTRPADFSEAGEQLTTHDAALRPDFTTPLARMLAEQALESGLPELPVRLQYAGPVFREAPAGELRLTQFHQAGIELIDRGPLADLEVLLLACDAASALQLRDWRLSVGHGGLFRTMLKDLGVPPEALTGLANNLVVAARIQERARGTDADFQRYLEGALPDLLRRMEASSRAVPEVLREPARLDLAAWRTRFPALFEDWLRAVWGARGTPQPMLDGVFALASLDPRPERFFAELEPLLASDAAARLLAELQALVQSLARHRDAPVHLTPAASRGISYYTGLTLELHADTGSRSTAVCGGGRYEHLHGWVWERLRQTVALRTGHTPPALDLGQLSAVGLAFGVERCSAALSEPPRPIDEPWTLSWDEALGEAAVALADRLRGAGHACELRPRAGRIRLIEPLWHQGQVLVDGHPIDRARLLEVL